MNIQQLKNIYHLDEAIFANAYFGFPSKKITVIGVTGTDGKTTTTHLIHHILKSAGKKASMISSIYAEIGGKIYETGLHTTTPRSFTVQKMLKQAVKNGDEYFVLETTSHAIDQNRIWGVEYSISVLTNITHDHLYHHKTYDNYLKLKTKLLLQSEKSVINSDDDSFVRVKSVLDKNSKKYVTYGLKKGAQYGWDSGIKTTLYGEYNKQNILAAYSCCIELGLSKETILSAISSFSLPRGRFEMAYDSDFKVLVDFAHTPNAIFNVLKTVKEDFIEEDERIIHVFGAASERDNSKRPKMGENSGKFADIVILTEEDYRKENVLDICDQIAEGLFVAGFNKVSPGELSSNSDRKVFTVVPDRQHSITQGISIAKAGDIVIITGKSHEKSLNRNGKEYPWDEYEAVKQALKS